MVRWHISSRVATAALVGLLALDVTLVAMALRSTSAGDIDTSPLSSASASADPASSASTSTSTRSPWPTTPVAGSGVPLATMLVALDGQHAWRVGAGSCSAGGATVEITADGGKTWSKGNTDLRRIVRLRLEDDKTAFAIGADASCAAELRDTSDGGGTWTSGGAVGLAWFRDPKNPMVVQAPGSVVSRPCGESAVLDLAVLTAGSARVLCADGLVRSTTVNGSAWTSLGTVDGAVSLAVPTVEQSETYVARLGGTGCAGVQVVRVRQQVVASCIPAALPRDPGQIAISLIDGGGWLAVGDATMRSTDGLATWTVS